LLNRPTTQQQAHLEARAEPLVEDPTYEEVVQAIQKLKSNKSPGEDNITAELLQAAGAELWHRLHHIIMKVWDEEKLPEDWLTALVIPIHKKVNRQKCENHCGISLLNVSYKILAEILYERLAVYAEEIIGDYQGGFRIGRSTIDQIFTIRQIMEKAWEYNVTIHQLFVDFKQAYDSIDRSALFMIMEEFGFPKKLINLTKATLTDTKCKIMILNVLSEPFNIETGLRQGDKLSTILFNLALEKVIRAMSINWKGSIFSTSKTLTAFADDADLIGRGTLAVKELFVEMERTLD
jgi:Reverse transcriptase (RNA-dependent DNA polymerase)